MRVDERRLRLPERGEALFLARAPTVRQLGELRLADRGGHVRGVVSAIAHGEAAGDVVAKIEIAAGPILRLELGKVRYPSVHLRRRPFEPAGEVGGDVEI